MARGQIDLTADMLYGFVATVLMSGYDNPQPIPECHMEWWELVTAPDKKVAIAAPRGHAKTTGVTHTFALAAALWRWRDHIMIVSDSEDQAAAFLSDIKMELEENEKLRALFGVSKFIKDKESEVIVLMDDGYKFRILARGSQQKLRGLKWRHRRPNLIIGDDLENDEMVMNQERRLKFRNWFYGALLPAGSDDCVFRIVGTILHLDSMLERLMPALGDRDTKWDGLKSYSTKNKSWKSYRYKAHNEDFSLILWPEKFTKDRLMAERQDYIEQGNPEGYAQEYLNYPIDDSTAYFRKDDFRHKYSAKDIEGVPLSYYSAMDFAISQRERSDYSAIVTVGIDSEGKMYVVDVRRGRWDSKEIIDNMFDVQYIYKPELFTVEKGTIETSIMPFLRDEMVKSGIYLNLNPMTPTKDKMQRARSIQARLRQGGVYFDEEYDWHDMFIEELKTFPRGQHDDMVDAFSWIGLTLDNIIEAPTLQEKMDEEWDEFLDDEWEQLGMCASTGY